ncbi:threonine/serine exporter ThrE family protein [Carboxylicivirga sp. M1479]|uniref:threonine/serine ThrE exporter family protein n=1 Tax=Carboxylicivirga sp. M1479 TaxID=2594476 RepID=UPI001178B2C4|nr:threonine/serine exporter family protein [Carboxylicivirga sp. M1479]TRX66519.1 threonine/serine exporter family protein [Carboxylicivirga sp. M1479]
MQIPHQYKFIVQLGKALHTYGVPSYKSQDYLSEIAKKKGVKGSFMDTPTWINYVFYEEDEHTYNHVECVPPGELNLGALSRVVEITDNVISNDLSFENAQGEIKKLNNVKIGYSKIVELFSFMISAGSFCVVLNTNWISVIVATLIGALIYGITLLAKRSSYIRSTLESLVAFMATIVIGLISTVYPDINISMTILASIIIFVPGLSITTALEEITSRNLVSGTAKLFDALVSLFKQFFGVLLGVTLLPLFIELKPHEITNDIPTWVNFVAIPLLSLSLMPVFKVRLKDIPLGVATGFICFYTTTLLDFTGILVSIFIGTIVAVAISKLFAHLTKAPRLVYLIPGIIMLVPGSKAFIGLSTLFLGTQVSNSHMGEQVIYIFMGIIGGLIFSGSFMDMKLEQNVEKQNTVFKR